MPDADYKRFLNFLGTHGWLSISGSFGRPRRRMAQRRQDGSCRRTLLRQAAGRTTRRKARYEQADFLGPLIGKVAGQVELVNAESGSVLATHVEPAFDSNARKKGLLGCASIPDDYALIVAPCSAVHTFFMRTTIDVIYVARNGIVTKTRRSVKPWRISGALGAYAVIEAAAGFVDRTEVVPGEILALRDSKSPSAATPFFRVGGARPVSGAHARSDTPLRTGA